MKDFLYQMGLDLRAVPWLTTFFLVGLMLGYLLKRTRVYAPKSHDHPST